MGTNSKPAAKRKVADTDKVTVLEKKLSEMEKQLAAIALNVEKMDGLLKKLVDTA